MADFVTDIIFARDIGGFKSIMVNNCFIEKESQKIIYNVSHTYK